MLTRPTFTTLALALLVATPAAAQNADQAPPTDSVLIQIEGRPVRGEIQSCERTTAYQGDTIRCVLRAYDAQDRLTPAMYIPSSSNPDLLEVLSVETAADSAVVTILLRGDPGTQAYLRLAVREVQVGLGIVHNVGGLGERFEHLAVATTGCLNGLDRCFPTTVQPNESFLMCAYSYAGDAFRVAKSEAACPGDLPVIPVEWESGAPAFIFPTPPDEGVREVRWSRGAQG